MTARTNPLRASINLAYANAGLWGLGSGLASTTLVVYFARELNASGTAIGWLLAMPSLAGLLRLWAPRWLERVRSRRKFCISMFLASAAALAVVPMLASPAVFGNARQTMLALAAAWTFYHVFEFIGVVGLWSWFGDLVPASIRGRFIGCREAWTTAGAVIGSITSAGATWWWSSYCWQMGQPELLWKGYVACASFGAALFALATLPLARMQEPAALPRSGAPAWSIKQLLAPWADPSFRRFMTFGLWYSMANGLSQSPRTVHMISILKFEFAERRILDGASRGAQVLLLPWAGRLADRRGNVPLLVASWAVVSLGSFFFLIASPTMKWWIAGAYVCWIAYAGLNVTLPNLMLGLSRPGQSAEYAASWFAWTNLAYSLGVMAGGWLLDWLASRWTPIESQGIHIGHFTLIFAASSLLLLAGIWPASRTPEPGE